MVYLQSQLLFCFCLSIENIVQSIMVLALYIIVINNNTTVRDTVHYILIGIDFECRAINANLQ